MKQRSESRATVWARAKNDSASLNRDGRLRRRQNAGTSLTEGW